VCEPFARAAAATVLRIVLLLTLSGRANTATQPVTFTATLSNGTTPLSGKNVTIYHYLNSVRYNDTINASGQITLTTSWAPLGQRTYYATFAGDSSYQTSTSKVVHRQRQDESNPLRGKNHPHRQS
jgi:hypothetical protein